MVRKTAHRAVGRTAVVTLVVGLLIGAGIAYSLVSPGSVKTTTTTVNQTTTQTATIVSTSTMTSTETSTLTTLTSDATTAAIDEAYLAHILNVESHNATAVADDYEQNATFNYIGCTLGFGGLEVGRGNIELLFAASFEGGPLNEASLSNVSYTLSANKTTAIVDSTFEIEGNTITPYFPSASPYSTNVALHISYTQTENRWLISDEIWNSTSMQWAGQPYCSETQGVAHYPPQ